MLGLSPHPCKSYRIFQFASWISCCMHAVHAKKRMRAQLDAPLLEPHTPLLLPLAGHSRQIRVADRLHSTAWQYLRCNIELARQCNNTGLLQSCELPPSWVARRCFGCQVKACAELHVHHAPLLQKAGSSLKLDRYWAGHVWDGRRFSNHNFSCLKDASGLSGEFLQAKAGGKS